MASPASSDTSDNPQEWVRQAKRSEGNGRVINERYSKDEYVQRRVNFLRNHEDYQRIPNLFPNVRSDADDVYAEGESPLSVQEVRRLELENATVPLLPLPTTDNTKSLDDFASYGATEWTSGAPDVPRRVFPSSPDQRPQANPPGRQPLGAHMDASASNTPVQTQLVSSMQTQDPSATQAVSPTATQLLHGASVLTANNTSANVLDIAGTGQGGNSFNESAAQQTASNIISAPPLAGPQSRPPYPMDVLAVPGLLNRPTRAVLEQVLHQLHRSPAELGQSQPQVYAADAEVAATPSRGLNIPVKPQSYGKKHADVDEQDTNGSADTTPPVPIRRDSPRGQSETVPPRRGSKRQAEQANVETTNELLATKKVKTDGPSTRGKKRKAPEDDENDSIQVAPKKKGKGKAKATSEADQQHDQEVLQLIAAGAQLPSSHQEAVAAQTLRRQNLVSALPKTRRAAKSPDLLPEFWSINDMTAKEREDGPVRCLCGETDDKGRSGEWIGCDDPEGKCGGSWQHVACVGTAVSSKKRERVKKGYDYLCQMCDPFRHRDELQKVRQRE